LSVPSAQMILVDELVGANCDRRDALRFARQG
jgi:hypothetical protein